MTTVRIIGNALNEPDTYVDVSIIEIALDGTVHLSEVDGTREWELPLSSLQTFLDEHKAATVADLSHPDHNVWSRLDGLADDLSTAPFDSLDAETRAQFEEIIDGALVDMLKLMDTTNS